MADYVEIIVRVRKPKGATVAQVRKAVTENWPDYVPVYTDGIIEENRAGNAPVLRPKWGRARLVRKAIA